MEEEDDEGGRGGGVGKVRRGVERGTKRESFENGTTEEEENLNERKRKQRRTLGVFTPFLGSAQEMVGAL